MFFLTYVRPPKKFGHIFSNFWPIFRHLPPLFVALSQKFSCETFQNYQISMYNSNTDSLGLILDVEVFFLWVTVQEHCEGQLTQYLCGEHHTGTEYLGVVIQSEAVHGVAIYQVDHARILLV